MSQMAIAWSPVLILVAAGYGTYKTSISRQYPFIFHRKFSSFVSPTFLALCLGFGGREILDLTIGEIFTCLTFIGILVVRFVMLYFAYPNWSIGTNNSGVRSGFFRTLGELNFVTLAFIMLPITKHSVWLHILGISFERAIKFHRFWGYLVLLIMTIHGFGMWGLFAATTVDNPDASFHFVLRYSKNPKTGWSNLSGFLSFLFTLITAIVAYPKIRRTHFEIFHFIHIAMMPLILAFGKLHMPSLIRWIIPAILLYGIDYLIQIYHMYIKYNHAIITRIKIIKLSNDSNITKITVTFPEKYYTHNYKPILKDYLSFKYEAGQYCFLCIPEISLYECHPFSISSTPYYSQSVAPESAEVAGVLSATAAARSLTFHIKDMGPNAWTNNLHKLALKHQSSDRNNNDNNISEIPLKIRVHIDGPFGHCSFPLSDYPTIVFITGGIGVTPCISMLGDVIRSKQSQQSSLSWHPATQIKFVWTSRESKIFDEFASILVAAQDMFGEESVQLYTTEKLKRASGASAAAGGGGVSDVEENIPNSKSITTVSTADAANIVDDLQCVQDLIKYGRPDVDEILQSVLSISNNNNSSSYERGRTSEVCPMTPRQSNIGVIACGPEPLLDSVTTSVSRLKEGRGRFHVHKEVFAF